MRTTDPASTDGESPISRAFRVLQAVVASNTALGVRELGRRCNLPRSTASRLVGILADLGMVDRAPDGSVVPGEALATLQPDPPVGPMLRARLRPLLVELVHVFGESAAIADDDGDAVLYVAQVRSGHPVSAPDVSAERHPFHLVAPGLIAMAHWDESRLEGYLGAPLPARTPMSMTDPARLRDRLARIRTDGFVWTDQELDVGVNGLAVPVESADGTLVTTISLYGPAYRFSPRQRPSVAAELASRVAGGIASLGMGRPTPS